MTITANPNGIIESEGDVFDKNRRRLVNISPEAYRHPLDKQATAALRSRSTVALLHKAGPDKSQARGIRAVPAPTGAAGRLGCAG